MTEVVSDETATPEVEAVPGPPLSRLAMVAYVLGLFPTGLLSAPLGIVAWRRIKRHHLAGLPVALGAIGLGVIWIVGLTFLVYLRVSSGAGVYEQATVETLEAIRAGQVRHQAETGAYGDFPTIAGRHGVSALFGRLETEHGIARRGEYLYRLFLPPDPARRATEYLVYAWPEKHGNPAVRAFLLDGRTGRIYACSQGTHIAGRYSGLERIPLWPTVAFAVDRVRNGWPLPGKLPGGTTEDGEDWALVK